MRLNVCVAAVAALFVASPALAQQVFPTDTAAATARGVVLQSHSLVNQTALDFGIISADPANPGTVSIEASSAGLRTFTGGVTLLPSSFQAARFDGLAAPLETVVLTLTPPTGNVIQDAAGDTIAVNSMTVDTNGLTRQANSNGNFTVYVGGTFGVAANQNSGVYSAQFQLTAEYQ